MTNILVFCIGLYWFVVNNSRIVVLCFGVYNCRSCLRGRFGLDSFRGSWINIRFSVCIVFEAWDHRKCANSIVILHLIVKKLRFSHVFDFPKVAAHIYGGPGIGDFWFRLFDCKFFNYCDYIKALGLFKPQYICSNQIFNTIWRKEKWWSNVRFRDSKKCRAHSQWSGILGFSRIFRLQNCSTF